MLAIGFICTPAGSFANDYTWPPRENAPVLTLLGPVYETGLELESELTVILADSLKKLANSPECCLPESYIDALGGTQYLRFVTGYSHDAEWGSIKSIADHHRELSTLLSGQCYVCPTNNALLRLALARWHPFDLMPNLLAHYHMQTSLRCGLTCPRSF